MSAVESADCIVCAAPTRQRCGACAQVGVQIAICSREHQKLVWPAHKRFCGAKAKPFRFPPLSEAEVAEAKACIDEVSPTDDASISDLLRVWRSGSKKSDEAILDSLMEGSTSFLDPVMTGVALYWIRATLWQLTKSRLVGAGIAQLPKGIGSQSVSEALCNPLWLTAHFVRSVVACTPRQISKIEEVFQPPFDIQHEQLSTVLHCVVIYTSLWSQYNAQMEAPRHHCQGHCEHVKEVLGYFRSMAVRLSREVEIVRKRNSEFGRRLSTAQACLPRLSW
ncbi:hypothetical protein JCM10213_009277 [Rhodosporidiobolus nylandii]